MIRTLSTGGYRLYARRKDPKTGRRREAAQHEREIQHFKQNG
jgi:hypothetical protein